MEHRQKKLKGKNLHFVFYFLPHPPSTQMRIPFPRKLMMGHLKAETYLPTSGRNYVLSLFWLGQNDYSELYGYVPWGWPLHFLPISSIIYSSPRWSLLPLGRSWSSPLFRKEMMRQLYFAVSRSSLSALTCWWVVDLVCDLSRGQCVSWRPGLAVQGLDGASNVFVYLLFWDVYLRE